MYKQKINLLNVLIIGSVLTLVGCSTTTKDSKSMSGIGTMNFTLPQSIKWKQVKNQSNPGNNLLAEWIPANNNENNTLVRVIYRRSNPVQPTPEVIANTLKPLQNSCSDIKIKSFKTSSQYLDQSSAEVLCAQLGGNSFGTISYVSIFTDQLANHILVSEVKMPPSKKAGLVDYKNAKQKQEIENRSALAQLMYQFNSSVRVCDAKKICE
ncbi:MAG: hypothetical protein ACWIPH_02315 [Ostreibacterium sp.]